VLFCYCFPLLSCCNAPDKPLLTLIKYKEGVSVYVKRLTPEINAPRHLQGLPKTGSGLLNFASLVVLMNDSRMERRLCQETC
jgi:hypothetical protein